MTTAKSTSIQERSRIYAARFNEKGCLQACSGDALTIYNGY
jgi:hypothetical protein